MIAQRGVNAMKFSYLVSLTVAALGSAQLLALAGEHESLPAEKSTVKTNSVCHVTCVDPHAACSESEKVIEALKSMYSDILKGDMDGYASYLDDDCTTFDEGTKKLISGKKAVVDAMRQRLIEHGKDSESPLVKFTIDQPYAKVTGDTAVVTFVARKSFGGKKPQELESRCTDIFIKKDNRWKKVHYRSNWKPV